MIDVKKFMKALKVTWMRRLVTSTNHTWTEIFKKQYFDPKYITDFGAEFLFNDKTKQNVNLFWRDVFKCWYETTDNFKTTTYNAFLSTPIWFNNKIKINNKHTFIKSWYEKGIKTISDLTDENGNMLSFVDFKNKYNIVSNNFLLYSSLWHSINNFKKSINFKQQPTEVFERPIIPTYVKILIKDKKGCTNIYHILRTFNNDIKPTSEYKWETEQNLLNMKWHQHYIIPFKTTKDITMVPVQTTTQNSPLKFLSKKNRNFK